MKKLIFGFVMLLIFSSMGMAEMKKGAISVTPSIGGYLFESKENLKNPLIYSLRFGSNITPNWGFEGSYYYGASENKAVAGNPDVDLYGYGMEALYNFMPEGKLVPFVAAGGGGTLLHQTGGVNNNRAMVDYGAGLKYFVTENIALRADVRHVIPLNDNNNNLLYTVGVNFFFGGEKKAAPLYRQPGPLSLPPRLWVTAVADTDGDGVPDDLDKCPGTPAGVQVDRDGCPLDTDGDGVPDYLDDCPSTPVGVKVDAVGCPFDSDGDGVYDYLDKCPGTPAGVKVDDDGCPLDSDKDGVPDYLDKCPGTPAGVKVDKDGCPPPPPPVAQTAPPQPATAMEKAIVEKGRVTLNVEFDTNKAVVKPKYNQEIKNLADVMQKYKDIKITIEGHTDNVGGAKFNETLSQRRADAIRNILILPYGIEASRLTAKGYGLTRPIASNATKEGRQKNRRVEAAAEYLIKK